ncbi:Kiwa anti-phage protein KwaB-like domain-containing protein [Clostridium sp.]|uniref:Kiwa anti-phage protein KwaB-like domain-containing protein n=1 Tax=Clostridium sp. TaxID=1506 RepID=UPI001EBB9AB1|nr:Kiwa anti-phage protein KwaB-like domain-containing protein [Clostridium sp.]MBS5886681.1 DUF4868 domain-containing protein [Clostridium sp.]
MDNKIWLSSEEIIKAMKKFKDNADNLEINVVFVNSNFERKEKYRVYNLLTSNKVIMPTINSSIDYLENEFKVRSFESYDLELSIDETVQVVESNKVINCIELIEKMHNVLKENKQNLTEDVDFKNLHFIVIQLYNPEKKERIYMVKKYVHPTTKYKSTFKFTLNGKEVSPFKKDILTINYTVDSIMYNNYHYILNRNNFNSIFKFKDFFYKIIEENKEVIKKSNLFCECEQFINDCMEDGRHLPRLTKVILGNGFEGVIKNRDRLPELKSDYKLSFNLTNDNRIEYNNKSQIKDILDILLNHFVVSALTDDRMIAKAIEKYKV